MNAGKNTSRKSIKEPKNSLYRYVVAGKWDTGVEKVVTFNTTLNALPIPTPGIDGTSDLLTMYPGMLRQCSGNAHGLLREHAWSTQGALREYSGNAQGVLRERSGSAPGMRMERSLDCLGLVGPIFAKRAQ